jgi:hypothetical protein
MKTKTILKNSTKSYTVTVVPDEYFATIKKSKHFEQKLQTANEMLKKYGLPKELPKK